MNLQELAVLENPPPVGGEGDAAQAVADWLRSSGKHEIADAVMARRTIGIERYGTVLRTPDGRNTDAELLQELIDALLYAYKRFLELDEVVKAPLGEADAGRSVIRIRRWRMVARICDDIIFFEGTRRLEASYDTSSTGSTPP